ncbi:probable sulfate transporter 3.4 isoform X2 [Andrographis paniculata]|uniref:probable sulfate transporter 3.4 isoform X2 n=1 Tax=Andrographis paniculata TaxID=175694 RepID=UPI0021E8A2A7|nr:probable sulfate transporter 3.4 isoform X2 [Andrographis paniculata]
MVVNSSRVENYPSQAAPFGWNELTANAAATMEIHRVCLPPSRTTMQKLRHHLAEIFFPDDPLHKFKNQTWVRKLVLGLQYFFPIFQWVHNYNFHLFKSDVVSGLTIASLAIPQGISYAKLANLPPIIGLYSSFVPPLIYSVLGSSRHLAVGPVSIASLVMGTMLSGAVSSAKEPTLYLKLAFTATFFAGVFQASLGFLRLGFLIDFLSKATLVGFMAGAAIIVSLQQLKGLLGITHFTGKMQLMPVLSSVFHHKDEWSWHTIVIGVAFLLLLLTTRQISMRKPKLFWISAITPLASVVLSTVLVFCIQSKVHDIHMIGHLPEGLNPSSANMLFFSGFHLALAVKTGIITGILSLTEGIAVGRTFAALKNYQVDGNKEMMAIGIMNMAGSCSSCYVTTGSFSRSAVNYNAGAQTVMSNIIMAAVVLVTLLFLMPLFRYTPDLILAAIIITAVIGLIDYRAAYRLWKVDKLDFVACLCSFLGVLFISVPIGLAIAVGISIFKILLNVTRPNIVALGNIPGTQTYQNLSRYKQAVTIPSFLILSIEAPIYFANSTYLHERVLRWIREEEERVASNNTSNLKCVILDMTAVTAIDTSGIDMISELRKTLEQRSLKLVLTNPVGSVMETLHQADILESFGIEGLYLTAEEAIADISSSWKAQP